MKLKMIKHALENAHNWYYKSGSNLQMAGGVLFPSNIRIYNYYNL